MFFSSIKLKFIIGSYGLDIIYEYLILTQSVHNVKWSTFNCWSINLSEARWFEYYHVWIVSGQKVLFKIKVFCSLYQLYQESWFKILCSRIQDLRDIFRMSPMYVHELSPYYELYTMIHEVLTLINTRS